MITLRIRSFKQIPGASYHTPKELWGFLTPRQRATPRKIAHDVLNANADTLGIDGVMLTAWRHISSLGADHIILSQRLDNKPIHRAYVTVHLDKQGRVFLIKNRAIPPAFLPSRASKRFTLTADRAVALAKRSIRARGAAMHTFKPLACWFPRRKRVVPAYRVRIHRKTPTHRSEWIVFIHAETGSVLSKYDNLSAASARARLFDPNPVAYVSVEKLSRKTRSGVRRAAAPPDEAYQTVTLRGLAPSGRLDGPRVSTQLTKNRVRISGAFDLPSSAPEFEEVMAYYHVDAAMRHIEELGYRGRWRIFTSENLPIQLNARGTREDNSWYSPGDRTLTFGFGGIDDAEDGETIVHEFGHALQDAICPDFGQSAEAAAMGEGFGDYLAASIFESKKPRQFKTLVMSWDAFEISEETPPRLRTVDSPLTFESFDHSAEADEHENGRIWSATLWDVRRCFTRSRDADRVIVESHFQLDGFTTFARAARAMIDADRNLYKGAHISRLKRVFRRRGIGPVE